MSCFPTRIQLFAETYTVPWTKCCRSDPTSPTSKFRSPAARHEKNDGITVFKIGGFVNRTLAPTNRSTTDASRHGYNSTFPTPHTRPRKYGLDFL